MLLIPNALAQVICTAESSTALTRELTEYLKKPGAAKTGPLAVKLCQTAPESAHPCPLSISGDRVADFDVASQSNVGIVPVLACAAKMALGAEAEDLTEIQAKMLDKYGEKFFAAWVTTPKTIKNLTQKFDDFALLVPDSDEASSSAHSKKVKIFEARRALLKKAPREMKTEVSRSLALIEAYLAEAKKGDSASDGDISFKPSRFREIMKDKLTRMNESSKWAGSANETLRTEGLNYKVQLKSDKNDWELCSQGANISGESCHVVPVGIETEKNECGRSVTLDVMAQMGGVWQISTHASQYNIDAAALFTPHALLLQKEQAIVKFWNIPEGFFPEFISDDLHLVYMKSVLKTDGGKRLAELHLQVRDNGKAMFVGMEKDPKNLTVLTGGKKQNVKGLDGTILQVKFQNLCH